MGLLWNLAARDATMQHRMVSSGVPEICAQLCGDTGGDDAAAETDAPPASVRLRALGLLQCLFEGKLLSAAELPRIRGLLVDAALALCRGGNRATLEALRSERHHDMPEPADADPFRLELAGMRALTRVTAALGAKETAAERGALDMSAALLAAGYYDAAAEGVGEGDVPFSTGSAASVTACSGVMRSPAVREAAIVCLRNLSSCKALMAGIGRRALYLMLHVNLDRKLPKVQRVHAAAVLHNIHKESANRTRFYKAELRYKAAGTVRGKKSGTAPKAPKVDPLTKVRGKSAQGARPSTAVGPGPGATTTVAGGLGMVYWGGGYGSDGYGSGPEPENLMMAEKENAEQRGEKMPIDRILNLDDDELMELRDSDRLHREHGEHLMRWMGEVFPAKPDKSSIRRSGSMKISAAAATGGKEQQESRGFLPNSSRHALSHHDDDGDDPRRRERERAADVKLQRRMCRPVNRIWGTVPDEGLPDKATGGLRQGNRRWGPVVHEYVQVDAENYLTPGSDDLLTAVRPASMARRLNEAAMQTAEAAASDSIGIAGGTAPRPREAMSARPARDVGPLMLSASKEIDEMEEEMSSTRAAATSLDDQAPPITKIMPAPNNNKKRGVHSARMAVSSGTARVGSSSAHGKVGGSKAGRPSSSRSAPSRSRPSTARAAVGGAGGTVRPGTARPGTAKSRMYGSSSSCRAPEESRGRR